MTLGREAKAGPRERRSVPPAWARLSASVDCDRGDSGLGFCTSFAPGGSIMIVCRGVVNVVERRHELHFKAPELAFEDADVLPGVVGFVFRGNSPEVVPFIAQRLGSAHDFEVQEAWGHDASVQGK